MLENNIGGEGFSTSRKQTLSPMVIRFVILYDSKITKRAKCLFFQCEKVASKNQKTKTRFRQTHEADL